jgi:hypothetical protein
VLLEAEEIIFSGSVNPLHAIGSVSVASLYNDKADRIMTIGR